jgi:hypothetical protein
MEKDLQHPERDAAGERDVPADRSPPFDPDPQIVTLLEGGSKRQIEKLRSEIAGMRERR